MRQRGWSFVVALCAVLCVALGASANVASAQRYVKVGFYMLAGDEQRPVTGYNVVMDADGIDIWSEGDITYYHVLGGRIVGRVGEGVEPHLYQGLYDFQYNAKTGHDAEGSCTKTRRAQVQHDDLHGRGCLRPACAARASKGGEDNADG